MGGVSTALMILPEHDIAVAVLCNAAHALPHCVAGTKLVLYCTAPCSALDSCEVLSGGDIMQNALSTTCDGAYLDIATVVAVCLSVCCLPD